MQVNQIINDLNQAETVIQEALKNHSGPKVQEALVSLQDTIQKFKEAEGEVVTDLQQAAPEVIQQALDAALNTVANLFPALKLFTPFEDLATKPIADEIANLLNTAFSKLSHAPVHVDEAPHIQAPQENPVPVEAPIAPAHPIPFVSGMMQFAEKEAAQVKEMFHKT
jgi:hypothetical protein